MTFSIVIASHGSNRWRDLAWSRAWPSAVNQGVEVLVEVLIYHVSDWTRAQVRNALTEQATGEWIITLDADDELAPGYVTAMSEAMQEGCLLTPQVSYVRRGKADLPRFWPEVDLAEGNWMVVGTAAPRELLLSVGGWRTFMGSGVLNEWDDWDLWIRCVAAGAGIVKVPDAVYRAHVRNSPHYSVPRATKKFWLEEIRQANGIGG